MTVEQIYHILVLMLEYINTKERESALFALLDLVYENDLCEIDELKNYAESEENEWVTKKIDTYLRQNGMYDEDDEDEW